MRILGSVIEHIDGQLLVTPVHVVRSLPPSEILRYTFPFLSPLPLSRRLRGCGCVYDAAFALQRENLSGFAGDESASFIISSFIRVQREPGFRGGSGK